MMLQLKTDQVPGYSDGQEPLIYLVSTCQAVRDSGATFVFSDGHGAAAWTAWFDDLDNLDKVDRSMVYQRYWADSVRDMDRKRRKQAEFLVHRFCDWSLICEIAVLDTPMKRRVEKVMRGFADDRRKPVRVRRDWYYR